MKALVCEQYGPPDTLVYKDVPSPAIQPGHVRIAVSACGVNFPDTLIIEGKYQIKPEPPFSPGAEIAGEITEVGEGVDHLKAGDRVLALTTWGGFAEELVVPQHLVIPIPDQMDYATASAFLLTYGTSYYALKQRARLQKGESILVMGAGGGVGISAVELANAMGAHVIAAASSQEKLDLAEKRGAKEFINYSEQDLKSTLKQMTGGKGVDVIYDPIGGDLFEAAFRNMAWNGRALIIGFVGGISKLPTNLPLLKNASVVGVFWGAFTSNEPQESKRNNEELMQMYCDGKLSPAISQTYKLENGAEALNALINRTATGKLVIEP